MLVHFSRTRDTKNTVRFDEDVEGDEPVKIGAVYVQKHAMAELAASNGGEPVDRIAVEFNANRTVRSIDPA